MGGVADAVSKNAGAIAGFAVGGPLGAMAGSALQGGRGLGDMLGIDNHFNAQAPAVTTQNNLPQDIQSAQAGLTGIQGNQQALAQALLAQSQGQGPNPAQLLMQQGMENANKQGAGMLASARGANPALTARMVGQNTASNQQHMAQNAGIMGAQQQLAAQGQLGSMYGQMGQQNLGQQNVLQNALASQNQAVTQGTIGAQNANAQVASGNAQRNAGLIGGLLNGAGAILGKSMGAAHGARIPGAANTPGDSASNDTVPAMLSPGEIVIPRSKAHDPDLAKEFIDHLMKREGKRKTKKGA